MTAAEHPGTIRTTCPYCGVGCGIAVARAAVGAIKISGLPDHPANFGRLCSKGAALAETLELEHRLLHPEIRGQRARWDQALDLVASEFMRIRALHGPDAVAFYVSGQLLIEDYYVANKLMKGFLGSANIDTNSRLCMASSVAGHRRAFGADVVPCSYEDLELADLLVLVGSNAAWCHPVLWQRMLESRRRRPQVKIIVIDPRRTATAQDADLHLPIQPGTDTILWNGLLSHLRRGDALDWNYLEHHTEGFAAALDAARADAPSIPAAAGACGLDETAVAEFYHLYARTERVVTLYSQGVNQSSTGTDKVNAIINCHLATGRIGRPGMGPFSLTGQPNAMGGREVGGLANQLAAHMQIENPAHRDRVRRFWNSPALPERAGLKAVDLFAAVGRGAVKAVWIMGTNPAVSMPDADAVRGALAGCEFVLVSDCVRNTDTAAFAHVLLPALTWGEKDGTVTNSERRISRQRSFLPPPGEARNDWWIVSEVARRMGFADAFPYLKAADVFREHAALSGFENGGERIFDIGALAALSDPEYEALAPVQWPLPAKQNGAAADSTRLFTDGRYLHGGGRARFVAIGRCLPAEPIDAEFPLVLNTGRVRDHWHTLTRTGNSPRLSAHSPLPFVEVHPADARTFGIRDGALVRVVSRRGRITVCARVTDTQIPGSIFVPMHWSGAFASGARVDALVGPAVDPHSGQPELKHTPVRLEAAGFAWEGILLTRADFGAPPAEMWMRSRGRECHRYRIAGHDAPADWQGFARARIGPIDSGGEWIEFSDPACGRYRAACLRGGRLAGCLFIAPDHTGLPTPDWLAELFALPELSAQDRKALLAGGPGRAGRDPGGIVCACHNVGRKDIQKAIETGADSVEAIGMVLKAGTECGSCRPELRELLSRNFGDSLLN